MDGVTVLANHVKFAIFVLGDNHDGSGMIDVVIGGLALGTFEFFFCDVKDDGFEYFFYADGFEHAGSFACVFLG